MVAEGDVGMWWSGAYEEEVVVGWCVREMQGGGWGLSQKDETKPLWLSFGHGM